MKSVPVFSDNKQERKEEKNKFFSLFYILNSQVEHFNSMYKQKSSRSHYFRGLHK